MIRTATWAAAALTLGAGCSGLSGTYPRDHPVIPAASLQLSENYAVSLEKLVTYGAVAGIAYLVLDPLAPNWQIEETRLTDDRYHLSLHMKRFRTGGDGEARVIFNRRAAELAARGGCAGYAVLAYSEGMESTLPAAQRVSEGTIKLVR